MTLFGNLALWLALLLAIWAAAAGALGRSSGRPDLPASARRADRGTAAALLFAVLALAVAVWRDDFNVAYVAAHSGRGVPWPYRAAVLYAGAAGALLLYAAALAACTALARMEAGPAALLLRGLLSGCVAIVTLFLNPFARLPFTAVDGAGLDPRLLHPAGALAPVLSLAAFAVLTVPFAWAVEALGARRAGIRLAETRAWALASWITISAGALCGARATYVDPAAPGSLGALVVWAAVTLLLHVVALEASPGGSVRWSPPVAAAAGMLGLVATAATVAGRPGPGVPVLGAAGGALTTTLLGWAVLRRLPRRAGEEHRWGAHTAHVGAGLIVAACIAGALGRKVQIELRPAESVTLAGRVGPRYTLTYLGTSHYARGNEVVTAATVDVAGAHGRLGVLRAEQVEYLDALGRSLAPPVSRLTVRTGVAADVGAALRSASGGAAEAVVLRISVTPFAWLGWAGGALLILGGLAAAHAGFTARSRRAE